MRRAYVVFLLLCGCASIPESYYLGMEVSQELEWMFPGGVG